MKAKRNNRLWKQVCKGSNDLSQVSAACGSEAKPSLLPVFVNKGVLGHSHTHSRVYVCGYFCTTNSIVAM